VRVAPSASLNVPAGGKMTVSAWVKPAAGVAVAGDTALYTKLSAGGEGAPSRLTVGLRDGAPFVRLGASEAVAATPLPEGTWAHVAATADGETVTLYVNGAPAGSFAAALPELGGEEVIGTVSGVTGFSGDIDEVNRANAARSAAYIALQAQSQGRSSGFATVATEAEDAGAANHDYMRILISALTPDAWVVIILLTIMSVISWIIMVMKGQLFGRTNRANRKFLEIYQTATRGQGAHTGLTNKDLSGQHPHASVARLFSIGQDELRQRMTEAKDLGSKYAIAPQSVAAIRSALDAGHVREEQRLAKWMVLLTIAISGGPFLGLLGTVLGVMITFAGVAAAGEVNITAIAPGIAAALLATVAGLAVAIPALFGYNYLTSQLDNISADNQVFVDELEKRIAETYRNSDR
jgi:biopolymer transport protein ExbB